ncbi:hypothetical protein D6V29_17940 [Vibrio cholerae]|nr:hypothetical protein [Vibrio cholerae]
MHNQIKNLTPEALLSIAKASGQIFYHNGDDSLGIAEICTSSQSFHFSDAKEKAHAKYLIQNLLENHMITQKSSVLYDLTNEHCLKNKSVKSVASDVIDQDIIEIKPNFCGIGINFNALYRKLLK